MVKRPRENLEVHWHQREQTEAAMAAVLGDDIFITETICLLGLHRDKSRGVWRKKKHWTKQGCGQSCGCCRAKNKEDWPSGCKACLDMWYLMTVNRQWMKLTKEFDGITETMRTGCNKKQRTYIADKVMRSYKEHDRKCKAADNYRTAFFCQTGDHRSVGRG